jgi:hypothetical protein
MSTTELIINPGVELICPRKDCKHQWKYHGSRKFYAGCPECHKNVNIERNRVVGVLAGRPTTGTNKFGKTRPKSGVAISP